MDRGSDNAVQEVESGNLPGEGEYFVLDESVFQTGSSDVSSQDRRGVVGHLVSLSDLVFPQGDIKIVDNAGNVLYDGSDKASRFEISGTDATYSYKFDVGFSDATGGGIYLNLNRELTYLELNAQQNSQYGLVVYGGTASIDSTDVTDLDVAIGGSGDIQFAFREEQGDAERGYLYLNTDSNVINDGVEREAASTYTGRTYVGNIGGDADGKAITVVFGKNNAFGNTSNLYVHDDSSVWFADKDLQTKHTQTVGGLTGSGELNFGNAAEVTLKQTSTDNGNTDVTTHTVRVDNVFTGSGKAVLHIDLRALRTADDDPL